MLKKILWLFIGISLGFATPVLAVQISVPSAPGAGYFLQSNGAGSYFANAVSNLWPFPNNATTTILNFTNGIKLNGWMVSTSTVVCRSPETCQYQADGTADDVEINAALTAARSNGSTVNIKDGNYDITAPLSVMTNVVLSPRVTLTASAAMDAVVKIGASGYVNNGTFEGNGATIQANGLANNGVIMDKYQVLYVKDLTIDNAVQNQVRVGSTTHSYSGYVSNINGIRSSGAPPSGSVGLYIDATSTDDAVSDSVFSGQETGMVTYSGGERFTNLHFWTSPSKGWMNTAIDDYGNKNKYVGIESDTPRYYGLHYHGANTDHSVSITSSQFFLNPVYAEDATSVGIYVDNPTVSVTVFDSQFNGGDVTHRMLSTIMASSTVGLMYLGNIPTNVVNTQYSVIKLQVGTHLGIGTTTPSDPFNVYGAISSGANQDLQGHLYLYGTNGNGLVDYSGFTGVGNYAQITIGSSRNKYLQLINTSSGTFGLAVQGNTGLGSTTPFAKLSITANTGDTNRNLLLISSSTDGLATSTLFSVDNTGLIFTQLANGCVQAASGILTSTGSACGSGGGTFPFTPQSDGNATSTNLIFNGGFLSTASSTINGNATTTGRQAASYFAGTGTATSSLVGALQITRPNGIDRFIENWRTGEAYPRSYMDGFGSLFIGGLGTSQPPLKFGKDPFNQQFLNFTNTAGPASIFITDATTDGATTNAESTFTGRVVNSPSSCSEWVDWFHNHYITNGDLNYGILLQKIAPCSYRNFITAFTDNASSDPAGQVKNSEWFSVITPTISVGSSGGSAITGTVTTATASTTITGSGTAFLTDLQINDSFAVGSDYRTVASIQSNTSFTVSASTTASASGLTINKFTRFLGREGIRVRYPTAFFHIGGGVGGSTVGSASLKLDNATALLTIPEAGAIENSAGNLYYSPGDGVRKSFMLNNYGLTGGQTIIGGNGPSENLLLQSTSNATRGKIYLGGTALSAYDESTSRLGIGSTTPWKQLSVGTSNTGTFAISTSTAGCAQFSALGELYSTGSNCGGAVTGSVGNWFTGTSYGNATSTTLGFLNGFLSTASSTIVGNATTTGRQAVGSLVVSGNATTTGNSSISGFFTTDPVSHSAAIDNGIIWLKNASVLDLDSESGSNILFRNSADSATRLGLDVPGNNLLRLTNASAATATLDTGSVTSGKTFTFPNFTGTFCLASINCAATTTANSWTGLQTFSSGLLSVGSTTVNGNATTTGTFYAGIASSTQLFGANLSTCNSASSALTWAAGQFGCNTITGGTGSAFGWTPSTNYATNVNATSTPLWMQQGLMASSTSYFPLGAWTSGGNLGVGTTSPFQPLSVNGNIWQTGAGAYAHFGNVVCNNPISTIGTGGLEVCGNDNTTAGIQMGVANNNSGTSAYNGFFFNNNLADNTITHFGFIGYNSSNYSDTTFGTGWAVKNLLGMQNTDGPISFMSSTSTTMAYINFLTGGTNTTNERMRIDSSGNVGIGTTTPGSLFSVGSIVNLFSNATSTWYTPQQFWGGFSSGIASSTSQAATITVDWANKNGNATHGGNEFDLILTQNTTINITATSSNPVDGAGYKLDVCQDSVGSRTFTLGTPSTVVFADGFSSFAVSSAPNTGTEFGFIYKDRLKRYKLVATSTFSDTRDCLP